jgi:hypothetical protein
LQWLTSASSNPGIALAKIKKAPQGAFLLTNLGSIKNKKHFWYKYNNISN